MDRGFSQIRLIGIISLFFVSGCATVYNTATQKQEYQFVSTAQEVNIGRDMSRQIEARFGILNDPALNGRLNVVGQRLAAVSDRKDLVYYFKVVNDDTFNAFTIPGGYIYVNKGLLDKISSDSE